MLLKQFDEQELRSAAQQAFPGKYIQIEESDIFLKGVTAGRYKAPWLDHEFFVSTEYAYEDVLINGNQTRYKVHMSCILLKPSQYDVVYDTKEVYYVAYEEQGKIQFQPYLDVIQLLPKEVELLEALIPV